MTVTIYHNPNCGTSRNVLAMIRQSGEEPVVIEYLKNPPSRERLKALIQAMGIPVRALLREKGTPYAKLGLGDPKWSDDQLLDFMMAHPILINRPIVVTPKGVKLCRPSETVLDILPNANIGQFVKEDGEVVEARTGSLIKGVSRPGLGLDRAHTGSAHIRRLWKTVARVRPLPEKKSENTCAIYLCTGKIVPAAVRAARACVWCNSRGDTLEIGIFLFNRP